jgi:hypothetical protein
VDGHRATLDAYVLEALRPARPDAHTRAVAAALLDFPAWKSMADRGVGREKIAGILADLMTHRIKPTGGSGPARAARARA